VTPVAAKKHQEPSKNQFSTAKRREISNRRKLYNLIKGTLKNQKQHEIMKKLTRRLLGRRASVPLA
jgi:hypothetical protein